MRLIDADKLRAEYKDPEDIRDSAKVSLRQLTLLRT